MSAVFPITTANYAFEIDGLSAGTLKGFEGGWAETAEVTAAGGPEAFARKVQGNLKYGDVKFSLGLGQSKATVDWLNLAYAHKPVPKTAIAHACNVSFESMFEQTFTNLWISEFKPPKLDANGKDYVFGDFTCVVDNVKPQKGSGKKVEGKVGEKMSLWQVANFDIEIGSFDCSHVVTCQLPEIKQKFSQLYVGRRRDVENVPGPMELGKLTIEFPQSKSWASWEGAVQEAIVKGNIGMKREYTGIVKFLAPDQKTELGEVTLAGISINKASASKMEAGKEQTRMITVEMNVHEVKWVIKNADM